MFHFGYSPLTLLWIGGVIVVCNVDGVRPISLAQALGKRVAVLAERTRLFLPLRPKCQSNAR